MSSRKQNTTVDDAVTAALRHTLSRVVQDILLCSCGAWFDAAQDYSQHESQSMRAELTAYKSREPITDALLQQVAAAYTAAPPRRRQAAVAALIGCSRQSASFYVHCTRQAGLITASR